VLSHDIHFNNFLKKLSISIIHLLNYFILIKKSNILHIFVSQSIVNMREGFYYWVSFPKQIILAYIGQGSQHLKLYNHDAVDSLTCHIM